MPLASLSSEGAAWPPLPLISCRPKLCLLISDRQVQAMHDHAKRTGCCPHWARPGIFMLCRWEVMALTHARLAVYLDLDVEVLPSWSLRLLPAAVGASGVEAEARKATEDWLPNELTRTPRGLRRARTRYAYQPPAYCTYQRRRAACPQGPTYRTYRAPWHPRSARVPWLSPQAAPAALRRLESLGAPLATRP